MKRIHRHDRQRFSSEPFKAYLRGSITAITGMVGGELKKRKPYYEAFHDHQYPVTVLNASVEEKNRKTRVGEL